VLGDVFKAGDRWFATGDLMRQDGEGYFYFVDRVGDTFRWKGQNVSTTEGRPDPHGHAVGDGSQCLRRGGGGPRRRAGMAALVVAPEFDIGDFKARLEVALPPYAQPLFLRLTPRLETTGTFKQRKADLVAAGFDPAKAPPPLYFRDGANGLSRSPRWHTSASPRPTPGSEAPAARTASARVGMAIFTSRGRRFPEFSLQGAKLNQGPGQAPA